MKSIVVFFNDKNSKYSKQSVFDGKNSEELALKWAKNYSNSIIDISCDSISELFSKMKEACQKENADYVIFSYKDLPFLNKSLTDELIAAHEKYKAEYSFVDGYPYGFAPEILDSGTIGILCELSKTKFAVEGNKRVTRDGIYEFIKTDINAFEVETIIADKDWRLFRFAFHCGIKENFASCKELFGKIKDKKLSVNGISEIAAQTPGILKTLPAFYDIQICDGINVSCSYCPYEKCYEAKYGKSPVATEKNMSSESFNKLVDKIAAFSENAVISLSAWGEPLKHPDFLKFVEKILSYSGISVLFETDGIGITKEFCNQLKEIVENCDERTNGWEKVMAIVKMDAVTEETYKKLHGENGTLASGVNAVAELAAVIPHCVYPQFVRLNENEHELESFFRYWNEKSNPSGGELIIQKYDDFCKLLPECKPADLSPIERNICWHLRRDITILTDGAVPFCKEHVLDGIIGNAFTESLEEIWKKTDSVLLEQINKKYSNKCKDCDEYYTFNF